MDEIHKVVKNECFVHRKMKRFVVGVDAIKSLNDIFSIKTQTLRVWLSESTLCLVLQDQKNLKTQLTPFFNNTHYTTSGVFTYY